MSDREEPQIVQALYNALSRKMEEIRPRYPKLNRRALMWQAVEEIELEDLERSLDELWDK